MLNCEVQTINQLQFAQIIILLFYSQIQTIEEKSQICDQNSIECKGY